MLRPDSQPLTGFEAGTIEQAHAYYHADPLRSWQARLARRSIEQAHAYYHAPFYTRAHALDGSVSEVLRAIAFSFFLFFFYIPKLFTSIALGLMQRVKYMHNNLVI